MDSKEFFNKFSFQDILAYFLPGVASTLGLLVLTDLLNFISVSTVKPDIFTGILFFLISFIIGITFSGLSHPIVNLFYRIKKIKKPEEMIILKETKNNLIESLNSKLNIGLDGEWHEEYYTYCQIMVRELLPISFSYSYRQEGLRLMRNYMMFPILIWGISGITYGILQFHFSKLRSVLIIIICLILTYGLLYNIWDRMRRNRERAVKNVFASFVCIDEILERKEKES
jgi:hypothetical protein